MKRILVLPGGGVKGRRTIEVLKYIEASTGKPVAELFDVVAGTSTGALMALALTMENPLSAVQLAALYDEQCQHIFSSGAWFKVKNLFGGAGPKYDASILESILKKTFGSAQVGSKAIVYTFNTTTFELQRIKAGLGWQCWEAARASSAAPTYFAPFEHNAQVFWDGGMCDNNPALTSYLTNGDADALVLNLQTGSFETGWLPSVVMNWKPLEMIGPALSAAMDGTSKLADTICASVLGDSYLSINEPSDLQAMDNGSPSNMVALAKEGAASVAANKAALDAFIAKLLVR